MLRLASALVILLLSSFVPAAAETLAPLIPSVLNLQGWLPLSEEIFRSYPSTLIAESLVRRYHKNYESEADVTHPIYDYRLQTMIQMRFRDGTLESVIKNGFFNSHQRNALLPDAGLYFDRAQIENCLIRASLPLGTQTSSELRPKYAFLTFPRNSTGDQRGNFRANYGNIIATFKDSIKNRSNFTPADSNDATVTPARQRSFTKVPRAYTFDYRSDLRIAKIPLTLSSADYWEVQIWGRLTVADVDYFMVNCPGDPVVSPTAWTLLKRTGKAVYQCGYADDESHIRKLKLLSPGP